MSTAAYLLRRLAARRRLSAAMAGRLLFECTLVARRARPATKPLPPLSFPGQKKAERLMISHAHGGHDLLRSRRRDGRGRWLQRLVRSGGSSLLTAHLEIFRPTRLHSATLDASELLFLLGSAFANNVTLGRRRCVCVHQSRCGSAKNLSLRTPAPHERPFVRPTFDSRTNSSSACIVSYPALTVWL